MNEYPRIRCWWCGIEPDSIHDVTTLGSAQPQYIANWPGGSDHEHSERKPSPAELEQAGHEALSRVQRQGWGA